MNENDMSKNINNQWISQDDTILKQYAENKALYVIGVKDCIETKDFSTTGGTKALQGYMGDRDATVIARLRSAGFKVAGKNNLHELCFGITSNNPHTGAVKNPHNPDCVAGGSSGGTAVAIALNQVRAGVGTDTGGSIRIPAAFCGIYGFRPTTGRYPSDGIIPISSTRDTAAAMGNTLDDMCTMDAIMADKPTAYENIPAVAPTDIRLGVPDTDSLGIMDTDVASLYEQALAKVKSAGVSLVSVSLKQIQALVAQTSFPVVLYEVYHDLTAWLLDSHAGVPLDDVIAQIASPDVKSVLQTHRGQGAIPQDIYATALYTTVPKLQATYAQLMADNRLDAIISPTVPVLAPKIGEDATITVQNQTVPTFATVIRNTDIASNIGIPSVSMPMGVVTHNLPAGLMLDGLKNQDEKLLTLAKVIDCMVHA